MNLLAMGAVLGVLASATEARTPFVSANQRGTRVAMLMHNTPIGCVELHRAIEARGLRKECCKRCHALHLAGYWWRKRHLTSDLGARTI